MNFEIIGIMSFLYAVARLLHYWTLIEQDAGNNGILVTIVTGIVFILWLLSLPVTIVFYFLNKWHTERMIKITKQEVWQDIHLKYDLTWKETTSSSRPHYCIARDPSPAKKSSSDENNTPFENK